MPCGRSDKRRFLEALTGGRPDSPPFFEEVIEPRAASILLGRPVTEDTRRLPLSDYVELAQCLGLDAIVAHTGGWLGGGRYAEASDGSRHYVGGSARTAAELEAEPFDPAAAREAIGAAVAAARGVGLAVVAWMPGILTGPALALGYEELALAVYDTPDLITRACDLQTERTVRALAAAVQAGADCLALGDDIADRNGPLLSPTMLRELWLPRARTVVAEAARRGVPIMLHCCGHLGAVLSLAVEAGFQALQPVAACNDVDVICAQARGKLAVMGTVDVGAVLVRGTPEAVYKTVGEQWGRYGPSGFVLGSNHSLNDAIPAENLRALAAAVAARRAG